MIIKTIIISVILVTIIMLALGVKLFVDKNAEFTVHSCSVDDGNLATDKSYSKCQLNDLSDCPVNNGF